MMLSLIRLMRPGDWVKNVFVLPALVFALPTLVFGDGVADRASVALRLTGQSLLAMAAFCLIASGFYAINDALDAEHDRRHPVKRLRPVASGRVSGRAAVGLGVALITAAVGLGFLVNRNVGIVLLLYGALQSAYNLRLKRAMFVDVVCLAIGFALRATAGAMAIEVQISAWLLLCVFFLCLYLGFIKRLCDLASAEARGKGEWKSPAGYDDRAELNWLLGVSSVLAIVAYLMYALSGHAYSIFGSRAIGFAMLSPLVMITIHRFYRRASRGASDSPLEALRRDRAVLLAVVLFAAGVAVTLYVPMVEDVLDQLFVAHESEAGK